MPAKQGKTPPFSGKPPHRPHRPHRHRLIEYWTCAKPGVISGLDIKRSFVHLSYKNVQVVPGPDILAQSGTRVMHNMIDLGKITTYVRRKHYCSNPITCKWGTTVVSSRSIFIYSSAKHLSGKVHKHCGVWCRPAGNWPTEGQVVGRIRLFALLRS